MSTDKENAENGAMEVEETLNETLDTKPTTDSEVSEESPVKLKEKDAKKKIKVKEVKKESKSPKPKENKTGKVKNEDSESEELEEDGDDEENDENDENEKSGDDKVPLLDQPLELSGTRERKKVQRFSAEYKTEPKDVGPIEIPEGNGAQLGNIPRIEAYLQKSKTDTLKPLHKILFMRIGKAKLLKKNIRKFNGFDFNEQSDQYAKKKQSMLKFETKVLREICSILDLRKPPKRDELVDTILSFLMKPEDSGKPVSKPRPKRAARSNHKSYSESEDDDDEKERKSSRRGKKKRAVLKEVSSDVDEDALGELASEDDDDEKERKSSRRGKKKHSSLKEVSSDGDEDEDFRNEKNQKGDDQDDEENLAVAVKNKEKKDSKGNDSDKDSQENETDEDDNEEDRDEGSSDYSEDEKTKSKKNSRSAKNNKKQSKANSKKPTSKKSDKKPMKKRAKADGESSEDDEPLSKKSKAPPTDEEIKSYVKEILEGANLEETTMKIVCKQVYAHYPDFDLAHKKDFIKTTVKSLIST